MYKLQFIKNILSTNIRQLAPDVPVVNDV